MIQSSYINAYASVATTSHDGQTRWDGTPYINHPAAVARNMKRLLSRKGMDPFRHQTHVDILIGLCWVHDVLEDCNITAHMLRGRLERAGVPQSVALVIADIVQYYLTHDKTRYTYKQYIDSITSDYALLVKYCDIQHNLACSAHDIAKNRNLKRAAKQVAKYGKALKVIEERLTNIGVNLNGY